MRGVWIQARRLGVLRRLLLVWLADLESQRPKSDCISEKTHEQLALTEKIVEMASTHNGGRGVTQDRPATRLFPVHNSGMFGKGMVGFIGNILPRLPSFYGKVLPSTHTRFDKYRPTPPELR